MSDVAALIALMDEQRRHWVDLPDGVRVRTVRPTAVDRERIARMTGGDVSRFREIEFLCEQLAIPFVDDWEGVTAAMIVEGSDWPDVRLPFSMRLWSALVRERPDWVVAVASAVVEASAAHKRREAEASGN